jgi:hypothetical protein
MNGRQGFDADIERLHAGAGEFAQFAERAGQIAADLQRALEATGNPWGSDAVGQSFAAGHVQPAADALHRISGLPDRLADVGERFTATADTYGQVDADNVTALRGLES